MQQTADWRRLDCAAYIVDMKRRTNGAYGVNEGLLASVLAALVFSVVSISLLCSTATWVLIQTSMWSHSLLFSL